MKDALAKGAHVGSAQCAVTQERCADAMTRAERTLAEILADVLRADRLSVDSHFFEELGADSLVMAKFCARVRKRGDLPSVTMKDIYRHPTIRSLAAALADATPKPVQPPGSAAIEAATSTSAREYILCGALQALFFLAYSYLAVVGIAWSSRWVASGSSAAEACGRLVLASSAAFLLASAVPIAAKWVLIGRWKTQQIRLWSLAYVRFWIVKTLIRSSPAARMFIGTPVYLLYLRALGARIGPGAVIFSRRVPVCTDLLTIGAGTVIRKEALFQCYRAQAGRLELGPVTLGRDVFVGERSVLDINTSMGDRAQLGHASGLHSGQAVPAGERWHGSPAQRTDVNYLRVPPAQSGTWRRAVYSTAALLVVLLLYLPLVQGGASLAIHGASSLAQGLGYRLSPVEQTGSNFGNEVMHANPSLSAVGTGTMVASGLILVNDEVSSTSFRVSRVAIGPHNFVGNDVTYPAGGRTGDNVLLGTKVLVPLDGKIREGVGLLGSPCFEIPRSVERDMRFDHLRTGEALRRGLAAKNRCDLQTKIGRASCR